MSFRLGLTGGIGMGKSTAAQMFRDLGHPVWDADAAVHDLYAPGGAAVAPVAAAFAGTLRDGGIDRADFIAHHADAPILVLDIPLLYETGAERGMDGVAVVSAPPAIQRARVMARPGMTEENFRLILSRQMPDSEKRKRADWVIPSDTMDGARAAIMDICAAIMAGRDHARDRS